MNQSSLQEINIKAGEFVFMEGDVEQHFYIVEEGQIEIFTAVDGQKKSIALLGPGESFGEFALFDHSPRSASACARLNSRILKVSAEGFHELVGQIPEWAQSMMRSFIDRLKHMNEMLSAHETKS